VAGRVFALGRCSPSWLVPCRIHSTTPTPAPAPTAPPGGGDRGSGQAPATVHGQGLPGDEPRRPGPGEEVLGRRRRRQTGRAWCSCGESRCASVMPGEATCSTWRGLGRRIPGFRGE
jgi:hypothetical protein